MKVFIVGGTGLLGYHAVKELLARGHEVTTISLPPSPVEGLSPRGVDLRLGNVFQLRDEELLGLLPGCEGFLYAAGLDDRAILPKPAYPKFREANVAQCARLVGLARRAGVRRVLVVGSYFSHFDRVWPELRLAESHCYIRSRKEQEAAVLGESGRGMDTMVLELPYVFGTMPGRKPRWTILVDLLGGMGRIVPYPLRSGGTAMVTARQAAAAAAGALEGGEGGKPYLVGGTNMPWSEFIPLVLSCIGKGQRAVHLPKLFYKLGKARMARDRAREGKEGGLDLVALAEIMYREAYIDPAAAMGELGYGEDDVRAAIRETIAECIRP